MSRNGRCNPAKMENEKAHRFCEEEIALPDEKNQTQRTGIEPGTNK